MSKFYPVAAPIFHGNEKKYVLDCLDTTWISSQGAYIERLEQEFAKFCRTKHAIVCSNGTTALHLALMAHDLQPGDEVLVPTLTFIATANTVAYCGAKPVFIDAEKETWNMDPGRLEEKITPRTKGIIPVHLYGHPVDMDPIMQVAQKHNLFVVEDAAEAIGALYKGRKVGSIGHSAAFSLFGNKIITTGEGGVVTTNDDRIAEKVRLLRGQGMDPKRKYWFSTVGYNYRMTNIQAAIGCAQLEDVDWHIEQRIRVAGLYNQALSGYSFLTLPVEQAWAKNVYWMYNVILHSCDKDTRDELIVRLRQMGIETRPLFYPMHELPPYAHLQSKDDFPVANQISRQGITLPTYGALMADDVEFISERLRRALGEMGVK